MFNVQGERQLWTTGYATLELTISAASCKGSWHPRRTFTAQGSIEGSPLVPGTWVTQFLPIALRVWAANRVQVR